ncbi:MAG: invasion associated locus B family protein [Rhizomicrobium sp.]|jgi:invasion protein IalB
MSETPSGLTRMASTVSDLTPVLKTAGILLVVLVVGGVGGWIGRGLLAGPPDVPTMHIFQDWRLFCPDSKAKNLSCEMSQDVMDQKAGARVARLIMLKDKDKSMVLAVTVPLQVLLEPGLGLKIGDDQVRVFQYKTCTEEGCLSIIPVNDQIETALGKAQRAGIEVARPDGKAVELPFSMKGYAEAYKVFLNNEAKRKSWWRRLWS